VTGTDVLTAALAWHANDACVLPAATDGSKRPNLTWKANQTSRPTTSQIIDWFAGGHPGLGLICGQVSGNLEMLELEGRAITEGKLADLTNIITEAGLADLWVRLTANGYTERTPSGGLHILYRVAGAPVPGNTKLARRPATGEELAAKPDDRLKVLAETRGEGGWVVVAPSNGPTHPTGETWTVAYGQPGTVPTITAAEREQLHRAVRCLDETPDPAPAPAGPRLAVVRTDGSIPPGDDYEARTTWADILTPHGWRHIFTRGATSYWRRPGKDTPGISATTGHAADRDRLYVFSSSTVFDPERPYTRFGAYALLEHGGDHTLAATTLRGQGYGKSTPLSGVDQATAITDLIPTSAMQSPTEQPRTLTAVDGTAARVIAEPAPEPARFGPTEDGLARALITHHSHELRYCPQRGKWLRWVGHRWLWDDAEHHRELVRTLARTLPETSKEWAKFKPRAMSAAGVAGVARLAQSDAAVTIDVTRLDARPYELNTPTGVVDLRTGELSPSDPDALHTRCTTIAPDFDRPSDTFATFLADTFGEDRELCDYIQRLVGLSCVGAVLEQLLLFSHGVGANGKSTLLEAVMHALGVGESGYAIAAAAEMLMVRSHTEHPAELAQLAGARLVVCSELEDGQRFAEARIKQLTGRDSINARFMRGNPFTFTPSHTLWLLGNHKPATSAGGPAFWRRVRLLPFIHVVPETRRDPKLGEKLADEAPAILAWIVRGAADYHGGGLREPSAVVTATEAYAQDQDTIARWVDDACHLAAGNSQVRVSTAEARTAYETWCREAGEEPVSAKRLGMDLRDRFKIEVAKSNGKKFYVGLTLLNPESADDDRDEGWYR
jgi:putative DNA primase/helicase